MNNKTKKGLRWLSAAALAALTVSACIEDEPRAVDDDDGSNTSAGGNTSSTNSGGNTSSSGGAGPSAGGGTSVPDGPSVSGFMANEAVIYEYDNVTFTAQVSDPDGAADVTGGTLKDSDGAVYGTFLKSGGGNAYAVTVDWETINELSAIEFVSGSSEDRVFIAEFTDGAGHVGSAQFTVSMQCSNGGGFCGDYCIDTNTDTNNCGGCGNECLCDSGSCQTCEAKPVTPMDTCDDVCAAQAKTCSESACDVAGYGFDDAACTFPVASYNYYCDLPFSPSTTHVECCCI